MKVCFVSSHAQLGGSEMVLDALLEALGEPWISSIVLLQDGPFEEVVRRSGPVEVIPTGSSARAILTAARRLRRHLRATGPDVIHANGVKAATVASVAAFGCCPVVWMKHDFSFSGAMSRLLVRRCAAVVGVSAAVLGDLHGHPKASVVHPAIDVEVVEDRRTARSELVAEMGWPPDTQLIGIIGRLHPSKGHLDLLRAFADVAARRPGARLVIAGGTDPSQPGYLRSLQDEVASRVPGDSVRFLGFRDDIMAVLAAFDVVAIPSVKLPRGGSEGFGLVAVQAFAAGTPVVAYAEGALPEVIGDCGALVASGDVDGLAKKLDEVLGDRALRERMVACGRDAYASRFALADMAGAMRDVYRRAAA